MILSVTFVAHTLIDLVMGCNLQNILRFIIRLSKFVVRSTYDSDIQCAKTSKLGIF